MQWTCEAEPLVRHYYDETTNTVSYLVQDPASNACAVVDSVLNFDYAAGAISTEIADQIITDIRAQAGDLRYLIETHVHADHLSAAPYIQERLGGKIMISEHITQVQKEFGRLFNEGTEFERDGSQFDVLLKEDQMYELGSLPCMALYTPGHTPACMTHVIGMAAFVGDTLFMPDGGTARADFPGGCARQLYQSIQRVLSLPESMPLYMCHDYQPGGRALAFKTSVSEERAHNIHVREGISEDAFVEMRTTRDKTLGMPRLILPSLQVNMRAGHFPQPENNDTVYLKIPITNNPD